MQTIFFNTYDVCKQFILSFQALQTIFFNIFHPPLQKNNGPSLIHNRQYCPTPPPRPTLPPPTSPWQNSMFLNHTVSTGIQFRHCYSCASSKSYEECQGSQKLEKCNDTYACVQLYTKFDNGSTKRETFYKDCVPPHACEEYVNKGNITEECYQPFGECKGKCCYGDECNKGNILDTSGPSGPTGHDPTKNSGKVLAISGGFLGLFCGLSLTVVSVHVNQ